MFKKLLSLLSLVMCIFYMNAQTPLPLNPKVRHAVLPNGLSYYLMHNEEPKGKANFYIAQKVGSTLETEKQLGLAHFLEHMAFNGSKNFPKKAMLDYLQTKGIRFGADINAYTAFDETVYNIDNIPTSDVALMDSVLLMLHDWSCALSLEEAEIDAERGVIQEEWRSRNDANTRMFNAILPQIYSEYQYTRMPIGTMEVVMNFPYQDLRDYYEKWYRPDQQGIIIVGDFDVDEMEKKVVELFSKIEMPENAAERVYPTVSDNEAPIYVEFEDPELQFSHITLSIKREKIPFEYRNTLEYYLQTIVIDSAIASMINNRLTELSNDPSCPFAYASVYFDDYYVAKTKSSFNVVAIAKDNLEAAFKAVMSEVMRAIKTGFSDSEFQRIKDEMLSNYEKYYNEREKTESENLAQELIRTFIDNEPSPGIENEYQMIQQILPMIPVEAINQNLSNIVTPQNQVIVVSQPKIEGLQLPNKDNILGIINDAISAEYEAYVDEVITDPLIENMPNPGKIVKESTIADWGVTIFELSNGAKVYVKPTDYSADEIQFAAVAKGGQYAFEGQYASDLKLIGAAIESSKLGTFDNNKMRKYLSGKHVGISYNMQHASHGTSGYTTIKDLETLLQLNYLYFTDIRPDQPVYESTVNQYRAILANQEKDPNSIFMDNFYGSWYNNNPLMINLKVADVDAANYENMLKIGRETLSNAADFDFIFVGNVDIEVLRPLVEQYIASLPTSGEKSKVSDYAVCQAKGQVVNDFEQPMETPSTMVANVYSGNNLKYNIKNEIYLSLISDVLDIVYTNTLREEEGGTYSPTTSASMNPLTNEWFVLYLFTTSKDAKDNLCKRAHEEFLKLLANGANEVDFNKVRDAALNQYSINSQKNEYWMGGIRSYVRGWDVISEHEKVLKEITLKDFNDFMKNLYNGDNRIQVIMNGVEIAK